MYYYNIIYKKLYFSCVFSFLTLIKSIGWVTSVIGITGLFQLDAAKIIPYVMLNDGNKMPSLGLGTYLVDESDSIKLAIELGIRHIDTSPRNEALVGDALNYAFKKGLGKREDFFISTKVSDNFYSQDEVRKSLIRSLAALQLNYVDLFLMHDERAIDILETWKGMEALVRLNMTKSIGVTNLTLHEFDRIWNRGEIKIANVQVEVNPRQAREGLVSYCQDLNIVVTAHSPLAGMYGPDPQGPKENDPLIVKLRNKYNKTAAQIMLRYLVNREVVPLFRAKTKTHLETNSDLFNFRLTTAEIADLTETYNVNTGVAGWESFGRDHRHHDDN